MGVTTNYGAASTYVKIASQTPGAVTSVTFSNIPQGYTDLVLVVNGYTSNSNVGDNIGLRFNGDSGSNYSWTRFFAVGTVASTRSDNQTVIGQAALGGGSSAPSTLTYNIQNYSSSTAYKTVLYKSNDGVTQVTMSVGHWRNNTPVTSVNINTYASGVAFGSTTTFTLYGIKAALNPKATGGDITSDGTYWYHTFSSSGVFAPKLALSNVDYLVVAGGGGGGNSGGTYFGTTSGGGGGGAGGFRTSAGTSGGGASAEAKLSLNSGTPYTVIVGAGGSCVNYTVGSDSSISGTGLTTITSIGGGMGRTAYFGTSGKDGGSGGGGSYSGTAGTGTANQGFNGGAFGSYAENGGGGGGAGSAGAAGSSSSNQAGAGGNGVASSITGVSITYAGGGGGGSGYENSGTQGASGGSGGGGAGGNRNATGTAGTANRGSGGGGAGGIDPAGSVRLGGNGGSGIVIVRYAV